MSGNLDATCWICGSSGPLSGEHRTKASDLRDFFGQISPSKPVYFTTRERDAQPIQSAKSNKLKTGDVICLACNTARSAPYDDAWMKLSREIRRRLPTLSDGKKLRGEAVFPYNTRRQMLCVHLFFAKLLGCALADSENSPFDLSSLSNSILNERPHPGLYLQFGYGVTMGNALHVGTSDINIDELSNGAKFGMWCYSVGGFSAMVALVEYNSPRVPGRWWHPRLGNRLTISDFTLP